MSRNIEGGMILTPPCYPRGILFGDTSEPYQSIYEESAIQQYHLGTKLVYISPFPRVFRYARNGGTTLAKALMTTSEALYSNAIAKTQTADGATVKAPDLEITVNVATGGTWVENEYAGGILVIDSSTGVGDIYHIVANKITGTDTKMTVLLERPIRNDWSATTVISLVKNAWREVDVMPVTAEGTPTGIPLINVPANHFCWLQTSGYAPCIIDTSETLIKGGPAGYPVTPDVPGACGPIGADTDTLWGIAVYIAGGAATTAILDLKLDS